MGFTRRLYICTWCKSRSEGNYALRRIPCTTDFVRCCQNLRKSRSEICVYINTAVVVGDNGAELFSRRNALIKVKFRFPSRFEVWWWRTWIPDETYRASSVLITSYNIKYKLIKGSLSLTLLPYRSAYRIVRINVHHNFLYLFRHCVLYDIELEHPCANTYTNTIRKQV